MSHAMFIINDNCPIPEIEFEIKRLRNLLRDLERAMDGHQPERQVIARAPVLDDWQLALRPETCLVGTMRGHPHIRDGHRGMTTGVWLLAPARGYARTLSRIYALRRPAPDRSPLS
jgi:hypothetical protein